MAMAPFPNGDTSKENPSIVCSHDGFTWVVPAGLTNPIYPNPGGGAVNLDQSLLYGQDGKLWCYFITKNAAGTQKTMKVMSSTDGVTWAGPTDLFTENISSDNMVGQSVIWDGSQYVMTYTGGTSPLALKRRTCATPDGTWSSASACTVTVPSGRELFEMNIIDDTATSGFYVGVITLSDVGSPGTNTNMHCMRSSDLSTWTLDQTPFLTPSPAGYWDDSRIYRGAIVRFGSNFKLWYSARRADNTWRIGLTTVADSIIP